MGLTSREKREMKELKVAKAAGEISKEQKQRLRELQKAKRPQRKGSAAKAASSAGVAAAGGTAGPATDAAFAPTSSEQLPTPERPAATPEPEFEPEVVPEEAAEEAEPAAAAYVPYVAQPAQVDCVLSELQIKRLCSARLAAQKGQEFEEADRIRAELAAAGVRLQDRDHRWSTTDGKLSGFQDFAPLGFNSKSQPIKKTRRKTRSKNPNRNRKKDKRPRGADGQLLVGAQVPKSFK